MTLFRLSAPGKTFSLAGFLVLLTASAHAGTIFSNVGPGFPGDSLGYYGDSGPGVTYLGMTFTATGSGNLDTLSLDLQGDTSPITIGLYSNSAGQPGALIESWSTAIPAGFGFPPVPPLTTLTSVGNPSLSAGTQYWLVLTSAGPLISQKFSRGGMTSWELELGSPNTLIRYGFKRDSLKVGEQVTVEGYQAKDGSKTANAKTVKFTDGRTVNAGPSGDLDTTK